MKKTILLFAAFVCFASIHAETNLLANGGFEDFKAGSFLGVPTTEYTSWSFSGGATGMATESTDVQEGTNAFRTSSEFKNNGNLYQSVDVTPYNTNDEFEIRIYYKTIDPKGDNAISLASYWASAKDGELTDDADKLKVPLPNSSDWAQIVIRTKKPEKATKFEFIIHITAKSIVLLDDLAFAYVAPTAYFSVTPETVKEVEATVNEEVLVATLTIRQNGLTQPINLGLGGADKEMFKIDKTSVTAAEETVTVTYAPTEAGHHSAMLSIYDDESAEISLFNRTIALSGIATDPNKKPTITISPTTLPAFSCAAKEEVQATIQVSSENCTDFVYASINNTEGYAFLIDGSMLSKNTTAQTVVTFKPLEAGDFAATITWTTEGGEPVSLNVTGTATAANPEETDFAKEFVWDASSPLDLLDEGFDNAPDFHNKTLKVSGWQNVVTKGNRAWWGYTTDTTLVAKATGYIYNASSESDLEMWLVTPPLNFNTPYPKQFGFEVLGEIIFEGQQGQIELYYIDATKTPVQMEHIAAVDALIPANDSELSRAWTPIVADLTGQPIADVFYIAFRFTDKAGSNGTTYQLDNVTWGKQLATGCEHVHADKQASSRLILQNGQIYILREGVIYGLDGRRAE